MNFSEKLHQLRIKHGLSQKKLADAIGVSQSSINYWEKGQRMPSYESVYGIAEYFNILVDSLLDDSYNDVLIEKEPIDMEICENILKLRKKKKLSQEELSQLSGIPLAVIDEYENKLRIPKNKNIIRLASVLDPSGTELLGEELPFDLYKDGDDFEHGGCSFGTPLLDKKIHESEYELLKSFRQLNKLGRHEAEKRVGELAEIKKYIE